MQHSRSVKSGCRVIIGASDWTNKWQQPQLGTTSGEQFAGPHANVFDRLTAPQTTGVAAVGSWSHLAILQGPRDEMSLE
jgi:hypothetical protein